MFFRTVGEHALVRERLREALADRVDVKEILELPAARMHTVPGFETAVFLYFSDIPFLTNWGTPLLVGPGSIHVAHTDHEHLAIDELNRAVDTYATLATTLLALRKYPRSRFVRARRPVSARNGGRNLRAAPGWPPHRARFRYGRSFVMASKVSTTATMRPAIGMSKFFRPRG